MVRPIFFLCMLLYTSALLSQDEPILLENTNFIFLNQNMTAEMIGLAGIGVVGSEVGFQNGLSQNPALLSRETRQMNTNLNLTSIPFENENRANYLSFDNHLVLNSKHAFGMRFQFQNFDFSNSGSIAEGEFNIQTTNLKIAYSNRITKRLVFGLTSMFVDHRILDASTNRLVNFVDPNTALAIELGLNYKRKFKLNDQRDFMFQWGWSLNNLGKEIATNKSLINDSPLPTAIKFGLGMGIDQQLKNGKKFQVNFFYQLDKVLLRRANVASNAFSGILEDNGFINNMFASLKDAPNGFSGELKELTHHFALEGQLQFDEEFTVTARMGYQNQGILFQGNVFGFNQGVKIMYKNFSLDLARQDYPKEFENGFLIQDFLTFGLGAKFSLEKIED